LLAPFQAIAITQALMGAVFIILYGKDMFTINIDLAESRKLLYFGVATILTSVGTMALDWADRIILERYASLADVGLYSAATRVASLMSVLLIVPFTQIWSTTMFEYRVHKDVRQFTSKILTYFLMAGGILLLLMTLLSKDILGFLIRYETSTVLIMVFLILALGNLVYGTTNILVAGIFYERKIFLLTYIYIGVALVKIFLNIVLIPIFGIMAASINALLASILLPCSVYLVAKKYFSFSIEWVRLSKFTALIGIPIILVVCLFQTVGRLEFLCLSTFLISITIMFIYKICLFDNEKKYLGIFINKLGTSIKGRCVNHEN
jgi:O-antigen/teichoic acid export membrane protein